MNRTLRLFLAGHGASAIGSRMQSAALLWHIYDLTGSAFALGALALAEWLPLMVLSVVGGDVADRKDRARVIGVAQLLQFFPTLALGCSVLWADTPIWALYGVAALCAGAQAFDGSSRKALIPHLTDAGGLARAMSAMDLVKNIAKLAGPALMGILAAAAGIGWVYLVNSVTFLVMFALMMQMPASRPVESSGETIPSFKARLMQGVDFLRNHSLVRGLVLLDFWGTFCAGAETLLPMVAKDMLGLGVEGYGYLASAGAVGALLAGFWLIMRPPASKPGLWALGGSAVFAGGTIALGFATETVLAFAALMFIGAGDTLSTVLRNTLVQVATPDSLRGRVTAISMVFSKSGPRLGQMEAGLVAGWFGLTFSLVSGGVLALLTTGFIAWRYPVLRTMDHVEDVSGDGLD